MKVELTIKQGSYQTKVIFEGYTPMVEALLEAVRKAAREKDKLCEIE